MLVVMMWCRGMVYDGFGLAWRGCAEVVEVLQQVVDVDAVTAHRTTALLSTVNANNLHLQIRLPHNKVAPPRRNERGKVKTGLLVTPY